MTGVEEDKFRKTESFIRETKGDEAFISTFEGNVDKWLASNALFSNSASPLTSWVSLSRALTLSNPSFPHL